jgi:hypothetical protein
MTLPARPLGFALCIGAFCSALPGLAAAQTAPSASAAPAPPPTQDDKKEIARGHFEKAITLFEDEAWDAALAEFRLSRELYATRAATKNAALCLRKLHRFDESLDMFEALLREFPSMAPEERKLAEGQVRELAALVGTIELQGVEAGTSVVVDGRDRGTTPSPAIRVSAGTHVVRVSKEGFVPWESQVQVAGGQSAVVRAKLAAIERGGRLKVAEQNGGALQVVVDNVAVGRTPWEGTLAVGNHSVMLRGEGTIGTQPASAPVKLNEVTPLTLLAEPLDAVLRVQPTPAGASVAIDGVLVGRGLWEGRLRPGQHKVEIASEGFLPMSRQLLIAKDARAVFAEPLERDLTSATWTATHPARIVIELDPSVALAPGLGGDVASSCKGSCSAGVPVGLLAMVRAGYQFSSGFGLGLEGGYLLLRQAVKDRPVALHPKGLESESGLAKDGLNLSGLMVGASASMHTWTKWPLTFRLGVGVLLGSVTDHRSGTARSQARTGPQGEVLAAQDYSFDKTESPSARFLYVAPEVRMAYKLGERTELGAGITVLILRGLNDVQWADTNAVVGPSGVSTFGRGSMVGKTLAVIAPGLSARYEF